MVFMIGLSVQSGHKIKRSTGLLASEGKNSSNSLVIKYHYFDFLAFAFS